MSRSDELWNELKAVDDTYRGSDIPPNYARLAAVAAIEALAKIEDIDAQIDKRPTE